MQASEPSDLFHWSLNDTWCQALSDYILFYSKSLAQIINMDFRPTFLSWYFTVHTSFNYRFSLYTFGLVDKVIWALKSFCHSRDRSWHTEIMQDHREGTDGAGSHSSQKQLFFGEDVLFMFWKVINGIKRSAALMWPPSPIWSWPALQVHDPRGISHDKVA